MQVPPPDISILVLAYNHEDYIAQTIESILAQKTNYPYKILICDDCSSDNTRSIIQSYIDKKPNIFTPIFNKRNIGLNETLKIVFSKIDTKYACFLGGDDYWVDENKIQKQVDYLECHSDVSFVHTGFQFYIENNHSFGKVINCWKWQMPANRKKRIISFFNSEPSFYPCASTCCFKTDPLIKGFEKYPQILNHGVGEGTLLHTSMCLFGQKYHFFPDTTTIYRQRENSLSHFTSKSQYINFRLDYLHTKIIVCKLLNIKPDDYYCFVKNDLDENLIIAKYYNTIDFFKLKIIDIDLEKKVLKKYDNILSGDLNLILYFWKIRLLRKIKSKINKK